MNRTLRHRLLTLVVLAFAGQSVLHAQNSSECRVEFSVAFRQSYSIIDPAFRNNAKNLDDIVAFIAEKSRDTSLVLKSVEFVGTSSPEGYIEANERLAVKRATSLEHFIRERISIPDSIVSVNTYTHWEALVDAVQSSDLSNKKAVLDILNQQQSRVVYSRTQSEDGRIVQLRNMDAGATWYTIKKRFLGTMRNAAAVFVTYYKHETPAGEGEGAILPPQTAEQPIENKVEPPVEPEQPVQPETVEPAQPVPPVQPTEPQKPAQEDWTRHIHVKTNAVGWALSSANAAVEIDLAKHWSFALPIYYSGVDYFKANLKFRIFAIQPEFRYWFKPDNKGWFVGGHFGMAYYNFAVQGKWRIQDRNGNTPALGGGISAGYRMPISRNGRWNVEFSLGAGVYNADYDKFYNKHNGKLGENIHKTFVGIDNVGVSFTYMFDLKKRNK